MQTSQRLMMMPQELLLLHMVVAFSTLAVAGQSNVELMLLLTINRVEGTGMTITSDASADSFTFASSGSGGGGTLPFTDFDGTTINILSSANWF